ncbi:MAG: response regulator [Verrucomicrobia bacterium]|nr:response regulator [Verrucomicrobiota bacterium]
MDSPSTILIVDDEPSGRELLEDLLAPQGYRLAFASNGAEGLQKAVELTPDVILLDVMMPWMDGYEVCRKLRANPVLAEVPIILLTALDDRDSRIYGLEAGADEFLTKPIDRGELRTRVRTITRLNRYRRLHLERSKFDQIVESAPDGILIVDTDTTIGLTNPATYQMLRVAEPSLVGQKLVEFVAASHRQQFDEMLRTVLADATRVLALELELIRHSGEKFSAEISARYFSWDDRPAVQIHVRDVTTRKELEAQFLRAQRLQSIGTLVGGIAHDLNNVLTPVLVASQLLREGQTGAERNRLLATIERSAHRGAEIIRQILGFARGVEGAGHKVLQVRHLVSEMEKLVQDTFPRSIQIKARSKLGLWPVRGDATQLHQVLMNLCLNARDAMPEGGLLKIEAENFTVTEDLARAHPDAKMGHYVKLSVTDTGAGVPKEVLPKLFDPFFSTKEAGKGTGLGLTTATGIVKSHNGFVTVESEAGRGARFSVYLPADEQGEASVNELADHPLPQGQGELILVVDDEPSIVEIIQATLERFGYRVLTAADGAEAVALYAKHQPEISLVLTDAMMPFLDGPALVRALQKLNPNVRVMGMSGLMEVEKMEELFDATTLSFLVKPFNSAGLLKSLHQALSGMQPEIA